MDHAVCAQPRAVLTAPPAMVNRNGLLIADAFAPFLAASNLNSIEDFFREDLGERLDKPGLAAWRQRRRLVLQNGDNEICLFFKRFDHPPAAARRQVHRARNGARSAAGVEYAWIRHLHDCGIPCPDIAAFGEEFENGLETRSVLVTQAVPGQSLEKYMAQWGRVSPSRRREILLASARLVSRVHSQGVVHRDLYLSHIFYDSEKSGPPILCLIDLQRMLRPARMTRWIVKDLASLNYSAPTDQVSRTERLRWLRAYLETRKLDAAGRRLAYRVIGKTATIERKERRRGRKAGSACATEQAPMVRAN